MRIKFNTNQVSTILLIAITILSLSTLLLSSIEVKRGYCAYVRREGVLTFATRKGILKQPSEIELRLWDNRIIRFSDKQARDYSSLTNRKVVIYGHEPLFIGWGGGASRLQIDSIKIIYPTQ